MAQQAGTPAKRAIPSVERAQAEADVWNSKGAASYRMTKQVALPYLECQELLPAGGLGGYHV